MQYATHMKMGCCLCTAIIMGAVLVNLIKSNAWGKSLRRVLLLNILLGWHLCISIAKLLRSEYRIYAVEGIKFNFVYSVIVPPFIV